MPAQVAVEVVEPLHSARKLSLRIFPNQNSILQQTEETEVTLQTSLVKVVAVVADISLPIM